MGVDRYFPRSPRRKVEKSSRVDLFIGGPKPVIDAFIRFRDREDHASHWAALEDLLQRAGAFSATEPPREEPRIAMNSGMFREHIGYAKYLALRAPLLVMENYRPAFVFMNYEEFMRAIKFHRHESGNL